MLYYTPPSDAVFEEIKAKAIELWQTFDDTYGYATAKVNRIKDIENVQDNAMYMVAMFDQDNMANLAKMLSAEARKAIADRLVAGGQPDEFNPFL